MENYISIDDFKKIEIRIGQIISAEPIEGSLKLLKLSVSFGEELPRQVLSGIAPHFPNPQDLVNKRCAFVTNLAPREMMGLTSQGMILATSGEGFFSLFEVDDNVPVGSLVK